jgi:hypothetical protein
MDALMRLLDVLATPLTWLGVIDWHNPSQSLIVILIYSGVGSYVLANKASGAKAVTLPVSFFVLFSCASATNSFFRDIRLPGSDQLQHIMIFSMIGTVLGSLVVLMVLRSASRGES